MLILFLFQLLQDRPGLLVGGELPTATQTPSASPARAELATGSRLGGSNGHYASTKPTGTTRPGAPRDSPGGCALSRGMLEVGDKDFVSPVAGQSEAAARASAHPCCTQSLPCVWAAAARAEPRIGASRSSKALKETFIAKYIIFTPLGFLKLFIKLPFQAGGSSYLGSLLSFADELGWNRVL